MKTRSADTPRRRGRPRNRDALGIFDGGRDYETILTDTGPDEDRG